MSNKENTTKKCPECGSYSLIPFVYGLMSEEARIERGKKGEYAWGGCKISQATDYCKDCKESFGGDSYEEEPFDEESFLKDREKLFNAIDKFLDEERDEDLYAQALKEAEGDEVEAEHIYFNYIRSQFQNNELS